jgi:hypothetical protein
MSETKEVPLRFATRDEACERAVDMIRSQMIILHVAGYIDTHDWDLMETVLKRDRKLPSGFSMWKEEEA